jgi:hypothetical protein
MAAVPDTAKATTPEYKYLNEFFALDITLGQTLSA